MALVLERVAGGWAATGLRGRGVALVSVGLMPVLVFASLVASYTGAAALGDTGVEVAVGLALALVLGFAATVATVAVIYKVFPRTPPDWQTTLHGALIAAGSISVVSTVYVAYLRLGANFERRYESSAGRGRAARPVAVRGQYRPAARVSRDPTAQHFVPPGRR